MSNECVIINDVQVFCVSCRHIRLKIFNEHYEFSLDKILNCIFNMKSSILFNIFFMINIVAYMNQKNNCNNIYAVFSISVTRKHVDFVFKQQQGSIKRQKSVRMLFTTAAVFKSFLSVYKTLTFIQFQHFQNTVSSHRSCKFF